jgi:hypothetical protein
MRQRIRSTAEKPLTLNPAARHSTASRCSEGAAIARAKTLGLEPEPPGDQAGEPQYGGGGELDHRVVEQREAFAHPIEDAARAQFPVRVRAAGFRISQRVVIPEAASVSLQFDRLR